MAQVPEASTRIASYPVVFEGAWYGDKPITRRDNSLATSRSGEVLHSVRLVATSGDHTDAFSVTVQGNDIPDGLVNGVMVRIPGSVSVTKRGERTYVNAWGSSVELLA